ncbi:MAG TPA: hypothetical protein DHU69_02640 [Deltaproteobacteria bacterium]|nr:hypothetical protein [Deltaproteobacteria bacterium]HCY18661.1 hypothetical protein [Deltaproteobacteria bacterium]
MRPETLNILCSPAEKLPLKIVNECYNGNRAQFLVNDEHNLRFPIRDGIPVFVEKDHLMGLNRRYRTIYDSFASVYDFISRVGLFMMGLSEDNIRGVFREELEVREGARVLETSVGTGSNLTHLPQGCLCYGFDLSWNMLKRCEKKLEKMGIVADLFLGEAEHLPFKDDVFDVVYQMGGINFFNDKAQAIKEMVRVTRGGTRIVIMDETEKVARTLERFPGISVFFKDRQEAISPPVESIPAGMEDIKIKELFKGQAWLLSFRKPS